MNQRWGEGGLNPGRGKGGGKGIESEAGEGSSNQQRVDKG